MGRLDESVHMWKRDGIQLYCMYDIAWDLTVILITICFLQNWGRDWQWLKIALKFDVENYNLKKLSWLQVRKRFNLNKQVGIFGELNESKYTNRIKFHPDPAK